MGEIDFPSPHFGRSRPALVDADSIQRVQLRLPAVIAADLYRHAVSMERTVSSVARDAIAQYLERQRGDP